MKKDFSQIKTQHLTPMHFTKMGEDGQMWLYQCSCGKTIETHASRVARGIVKSCGHLRYTNNKNNYRNYSISAYKRIWSSNKYKAKGLSFDNFLVLCKQNCDYCGEPPRMVNPISASYEQHVKNHKSPHTEKCFNNYFVQVNGIDKVVPCDDYRDLSNLVPCCTPCNMLKRKYGREWFLNHIEKIHTIN